MFQLLHWRFTAHLKRQSVRLTSSNYNEAYKRCKNKLNKLIKTTKEEYFKTKLSNANNSKESWQAINELLNKKPKTTHVTQLNVDDQVITGDTNIADCFNQYFSSIGCKLSNNVQNINVDPMTFVTPTESSFHFSCISVQETFDALNQLNLRKSPGLDGISVRLLKDTSDVIAQPLANIFNLSLQTAIFPDEWKIAKVSPVFKEGNKTDCGNYSQEIANAFLSPGVNSRAELIPSTRAYAWNGEREVCTEKYRTEVFFEMIEPVRRARFVQKDRGLIFFCTYRASEVNIKFIMWHLYLKQTRNT